MSEDIVEKLTYWVQKIFWPAVALAVVAVIASVGFHYKNSLQLKESAKDQDELFAIRQELAKVTEALEPKEEPKKDAKVPAVPKEKPKLSADVLEKAHGPIVQKLQNYIQANQGTQSAVEAALLVAELTQDYNKTEMAIESLNTALKGVDSKLFLFGVAQTELGNLYAKNEKCLEAAQAWEKVIADKNHAYIAGNLRLKAGVCYEKQSQLDKAELLYQEVVNQEPTSFSGRTAKKFLLHIKYLKSKKG
jgi:predicted negative regulator of RcsB-dependent stress response